LFDELRNEKQTKHDSNVEGYIKPEETQIEASPISPLMWRATSTGKVVMVIPGQWEAIS